MSTQDLNIFKAQLLEVLHPMYGLREASNIVAYFFDAVKNDLDYDRAEVLRKFKAGWPVQYVSNTAFFYGHEFFVDDRVLIPRPETEELTHWIVTETKHEKKEISILDIGTGSGCILISILLKLQNANGFALDISSKALEVCQLNASKFGVAVNIINQDIFSLNAEGMPVTFDVIVCNPPYILQDERDRMDGHVIAHEPFEALFVEGNDPLVFYEHIISNLKYWLNQDGSAYFETSDLYHDDLLSIVKDFGLKGEFKRDMQEKWRMLKVSL